MHLMVQSYFPTEPGAILELQRRVAMLHAQAVTQQLLDLPVPKKQKLELLQAVTDDINESLLHVGAVG
ncbi:MAG: hypothetical protein FWC27_11040 [Firmicutes bacterium]|nr:hypothetical protein [Bacillota bacterium]